MTKNKILAQGAEAIITLKENKVLKNRTPKSYRNKELDDKIRKSRTKKEAKILEKASKIIRVPKVINQDKYSLTIEYLKGDKLSEKLNSYKQERQDKTMKLLGESVARLHEQDIIHGDLTTSNVILTKDKDSNFENVYGWKKEFKKNTKEGIPITEKYLKNAQGNKNLFGIDKVTEERSDLSSKLYLLDFGLSFISKRIEDRAVDLHLIKQALEAKHWQSHEKLFQNFLLGYRKYKESKKVLEQLKKVESRGRYKH